MQQTVALHRALKRALKERRKTYRDAALVLSLSEASVKRLFSQSQISLPRIEQLLDWLEIDFAELITMAEQGANRITELSPDQELALVEDRSLLLVALMLLNKWSQREILEVFDFTEGQLFTRLAELERMGFIEILPYSRVKLRVARNFAWSARGPVQQFFMNNVLREFLAGGFAAPGDKMRFVNGMLSRASILKLHQLIDDLAERFDDIVADDLKLPAAERYGTSMFLGLRPWELADFTALRRTPATKKFKPQD